MKIARRIAGVVVILLGLSLAGFSIYALIWVPPRQWGWLGFALGGLGVALAGVALIVEGREAFIEGLFSMWYFN